jgi:hypothetical protein
MPRILSRHWLPVDDPSGQAGDVSGEIRQSLDHPASPHPAQHLRDQQFTGAVHSRITLPEVLVAERQARADYHRILV